MSDRARNLMGKAYSPPTLVIYGGLAKLTASGTITTGENMGAMMNNKT